MVALNFDEIQRGDGWTHARAIVNRWRLELNPLARLVRRSQHNRRPERILYSSLDPKERASLKDPRVKTLLFNACNVLYPGQVAELTLDELSLFNKLNNDESSAFVVAHFALQLIRSHTKQGTLYSLENQLVSYGGLGIHLGTSVEKLGVKNGLLLGILRPLAFAAMSEFKRDKFDDYLEKLKHSQQLFDLDSEFRTFECKYPQVAAMCLVKLGFSKELALAHYLALDFEIENISVEAAELRASFELINAAVSDYTSKVSQDYIGALLGNNYEELLDAAIRKSKHNNILRKSQEDQLIPPTSISISVCATVTDVNNDFIAPDWILKEISLEDLASFRTMIRELLDEVENPH